LFVDFRPGGAVNLFGARRSQNKKFESAWSDSGPVAQFGDEGGQFGVGQARMPLVPFSLGTRRHQQLQMAFPPRRVRDDRIAIAGGCGCIENHANAI